MPVLRNSVQNQQLCVQGEKHVFRSFESIYLLGSPGNWAGNFHDQCSGARDFTCRAHCAAATGFAGAAASAATCAGQPAY
jgi:hypothetical protein